MARDDVSDSEKREWDALCPPVKMAHRLIEAIGYKNNPLTPAQKYDLLQSFQGVLEYRTPENIDRFVAKVNEVMQGQVWDYRPTEKRPAREFHMTHMSIAPKRPDGTREERRLVPLNTTMPGEDEYVMQCLRFEAGGKTERQVTHALDSLSWREIAELQSKIAHEMHKYEPKEVRGASTASVLERREKQALDPLTV